MDNLYYEAANLLQRLYNKETSFRALIFKSPYKNKKQLYKICLETSKRREAFESMLTEHLSELAACQNYADAPPQVLHVLLYEYLLGIGLQKCGAQWRLPIEERSRKLSRLKNIFFTDTLFEARKKNHDDDNTTVCDESFEEADLRLPRYARVNTLKMTPAEVIDILKANGWTMIDKGYIENRKRFRNLVDNLKPHTFCLDQHFDDLLVFPHGTDLHNEYLVTNGCLVLQDKSSCLPVLCLELDPRSQVFDLCAAPGVKTSHIACLLRNEGKIFACDINPERFITMKSILTRNGVKCATIENRDVLRLNLARDKKYQDVEYALLDVPCSGSGMVNRIDFSVNPEEVKDPKRIKRLANLQSMMLKHALTLPRLYRLVYSTCSVHEQENEMVVAEVLAEVKDHYRLVEAMPKWKHRGKRKYEFGRLCLRSSPEKERTNGFFVAVFEAQPCDE